MIHDVLLSCLNLRSSTLPLEDILASGSVSEFLHPNERTILEDIIAIINSLRDIAKFAEIYGTNTPINEIEGETLQNGLYLKAFANGLEKVLDEFLDEVVELERRYLQNPTQTLMHIYQKLQVYEPLADFLKKLIRGIRLQRLHGCAILSHVQKNLPHGDQHIQQAMKLILDAVNIVFFKHLSHWILNAKIYDSYGEFFIQCIDRSNSTVGSEKGSVCGRQTATSLSDVTSSTYGDIWRYEICYDYLPYFLSSAWAEKVLFIGQTVLIFKVDVHKVQKHTFSWKKSQRNAMEIEDSLWNGKEHVYFEKIQSLLKANENVLHHYERVIDEIKQYVSKRLSEIAINQADLVQQLKIIKEYFLLGRGEIFLDFIRLTSAIDKDTNRDIKMREFVKSFETAAQNIGVSEILEQITLSISKQGSPDDSHDAELMQNLQLDYCINWPLHLLFSPKVMERYNMIFRFLLHIKKTQYEMNMIWLRQTAETKSKQIVNQKILHLRNQLMFFVNTLQYYIQVDVLESQFSILLGTINNKADFEQIQKAHSVFQANILSLCFLLSEEPNLNQNSLHSTTFSSTHPVFQIFHEIMNLCEDFYIILNSNKTAEALNSAADVLYGRFGNLINQLLTMLVGLKAMPGTTALSQLLLRLDFNRWFSLENKLSNEQLEFL